MYSGQDMEANSGPADGRMHKGAMPTHTGTHRRVRTHPAGHYSDVKEKDSSLVSTSCVDLEGIMPSEIRQIKTNTI